MQSNNYIFKLINDKSQFEFEKLHTVQSDVRSEKGRD